MCQNGKRTWPIFVVFGAVFGLLWPVLNKLSAAIACFVLMKGRKLL